MIQKTKKIRGKTYTPPGNFSSGQLTFAYNHTTTATLVNINNDTEDLIALILSSIKTMNERKEFELTKTFFRVWFLKKSTVDHFNVLPNRYFAVMDIRFRAMLNSSRSKSLRFLEISSFFSISLFTCRHHCSLLHHHK